MPDITNPQVVDYCNNVLRPLSDKLEAEILKIPAFVATYNARDLGTIINDAGASNFIGDGSATDGRTRVTGGDVFNLVTLMNDLITFYTSGRKDVVAKWNVNGDK